MAHKQPGLDGRHRDADGRISRKHSNAQVGGMRKTYGDGFAPDFRSDAHLGTVLERTGYKSLTQLRKGKR